MLGLSKDAVVRTNATFFLTGNNNTIGTDLVRRILSIKLDPRSSRPENRRMAFCAHPLDTDKIAHSLML